jgi:hypothetical protein
MTGLYNYIEISITISIILLLLVPAVTTIVINKSVTFPKKAGKLRVLFLALIFFVVMMITLLVIRSYQYNSFFWLLGYIICLIIYWLLKRKK